MSGLVAIAILLLSVASAMLYRMGGASETALALEWGWVPKWIRNFPKKRDVGCGVVTLLAALLIGVKAPWWTWVLAFGLHWASLSTYWDFLFGFDNHWFHGFMIGMSMLPIAFFWNPVGLGVRALALAILMGGISKATANDWIEEMGRGLVMPLTFLIIYA